MSKFDAGTAVDPMTVDFSKWGGPVGDIPEPTGDMVDKFMDRMRGLHKEFKGLLAEGEKAQESKDEDTMEAWVEKVDMEAIRGRTAMSREWVSELTQGFLSVEVLTACGPRVFQKFLSWLTGELSPKADESN